MPRSTDGEMLDAITLKETLWDTLKKIRSGKITAGSGDAVAAQAREILRCVKVQLAIFSAAGQSVSSEMVDFAKPKR